MKTNYALLGVTLLVYATTATGCAIENDDGDEATASTEDKFVERPFSDILNSSLIEPAMKGPIRIRIAHSAPLTKPWADWTRLAIGRWLAPLRAFPGAGYLTREVQFVDRDEHLTLIVDAGEGRAHYKPGNPIQQQFIAVYEKSDNADSLLHEFGHAMGLGDTYVEGVWTCGADQPASVMCNGWLDGLRADDMRGVRFEYCQRTRNCNAYDYKDSYGGTGGLFRATCPSNNRLVGLDVRSGWFVDAVWPICENVTTHIRQRRPRIGGDGGSDFASLRCPERAYVKTLRVNAGTYVDSIALVCSDGTATARAGGSGGVPGTYSCPAAFNAAVGLRGGASGFVGRLGLSCDDPSGPTFVADRSGPQPI